MTGYDGNKTRLDVARALSDIASLYLDLWAEAEAKHADREMPGGDAMNMLGPVANLEAWEHRYEAAEARAMEYDEPLPRYVEDQIDTETHPLLVLATWEDVIREECDQPTDLRATVPRAIDFLRGKLDWMIRVDEFEEPEWLAVESLLKDLRRVRGALEGVLLDGTRVDRGADCPSCFKPLIHQWAGSLDNPKTIEDDHWSCSTCTESRPYHQYLKLVEDEYMDRATWLQADHMQTKYRIPIGTLKSWAHREHVKKRRNVHTGRMVYRVIDAVTKRDEAKERESSGVA